MDTVTTSSPESQNQRFRILGPWIAALWLLFLLSPFIEGLHHRSEPRGVATMVLSVAFAAVYIQVFLIGRRSMRGLAPEVPLAAAFSYLASLAVMGALLVVLIGESGFAAAPFVAVAGIILLPLRYGGPAAGLVVAAVAIYGLAEHSSSQFGTAFGVVAGSLAVFGFKTVLRRNLDLIAAERDNSQLLVENERNRFARDLHDILGHSLTVITVKAELAGRLMDIDPERARAEVKDLERLSRDALADVRRAVEGYRELTLPGELARARAALMAAEIEPLLPQSTDEVPSELRELFAWTVREGVTNVIRHSGAKTCEIVLTPQGAEIRDDGRGPAADGPGGSGLIGLRERAAAVGATVVTHDLVPGFSLQVVR